MRDTLIVTIIISVLSISAAHPSVRSYHERSPSDLSVNTVTYPVIDSLVVVKFDSTYTADSVTAFALSTSFLDADYEFRTHGDVVWVLRNISAMSYENLRDSLLIRSEVRFVNPVLQWSPNGLMILKDWFSILVSEGLAAQAITAQVDSLDLSLMENDPVTSRLFNWYHRGGKFYLLYASIEEGVG